MKKQFFEEVLNLVACKLGEGYKVELRDVVKNNGMKMTALVISKVNNALGINIYLDHYYSQYPDIIDYIHDKLTFDNIEAFAKECVCNNVNTVDDYLQKEYGR